MTKDKVQVYSTNKQYEADMIIAYLADHDVTGFILNKMDSAYHFGDIEILVNQNEVIKSKKLIEDFLQHE